MIPWSPRSELQKNFRSSSLTQRGLKSIKLLRSLFNKHLSQSKLQRLPHLPLMLLRSRVKSQLSFCLLQKLHQRQASRMTYPAVTSCQSKHLTPLLAIGWLKLELQTRTWDKLRREDSFLRSSSWTPTVLALKVLSSTNMLRLSIHSLRRTRSTASAVAWARWLTRSGLTWTTTSASSSTNWLQSVRYPTMVPSATKPLISAPSMDYKKSCQWKLSISLELFPSLERLSRSILRAVAPSYEDMFKLQTNLESLSQSLSGVRSYAKETTSLQETSLLSRQEESVNSVAEASTALATMPRSTWPVNSRRRRDVPSSNNGPNNSLNKAWVTWSKHSLEPNPSLRSLNLETSKEWEKWRERRNKAIST